MAENNMLKQQIAYLERTNHPNHNNNRNGQQQMALNNRDDEGVLVDDSNDVNMPNNQAENYGYYNRAAPAHKFKRHIALLGVFTLMLCVYGLLPRSDNGGVNFLGNSKSIFNNNSDSIVVSTTNEADHSGLNVRPRKPKRGGRTFGHMDSDPWSEPWGGNRPQSPHNRRRPSFGGEDEDNTYSYIITAIEITVLLAYLGYLLYVGLSFYKSHTSKKRQQDEDTPVDVVAI